MRAGVRFMVTNPPTPRIGERQAQLKTGFVERLLQRSKDNDQDADFANRFTE
jgi:hypothetical protein